MVSALPGLAPPSTADEQSAPQAASETKGVGAEAPPPLPRRPEPSGSTAPDQDSAAGELSAVSPSPEPPPAAASRKAARPSSSRVRAVSAETPPPAPEANEGPRYLRFEPKTVRLTAEQVDALQTVETKLRRAARGKRRQGDELPSWNMLARLGIDLVLREADRLSGVTENELRASLGLEPLDL